MNASAKILLIDDDKSFLQSLSNMLSYKNYSVKTESSSKEALRTFSSEPWHCVLMDVKMPGVDGLELLESFLNLKRQIPVVMVSGQSNISTAVEAIKLGAYDFVEKPVDINRLLVVVENAVHLSELSKENSQLVSFIEDSFNMIGKSELLLDMKNSIRKVAPTHAKVLILGETGVGKELVAKSIHFNSSRKSKPFLKINCASIPAELLESELFGYKKGSFTNAVKDYKGKFLLADGGTLFLDEIGDLNFDLQAKLLRVLQDGEIDSIGSEKPILVDVRIIAATNRKLTDLVKEGRFREDLFHRLNVVSITVPPLRERKGDIELLSQHFLTKFSEEYNKKLNSISKPALMELTAYSWPGNIRELQNVIEKVVIFSEGSEIKSLEIIKILTPNTVSGNETLNSHPLKASLDDFEREVILNTLITTDWKISETADLLEIDRTTLFKKMKKYNLTHE